MTARKPPPSDPRRIEYRPLTSLRGNPANPKAHQLDVIDGSVGRFGFIESIVVDDRTDMLISGHGRTETLTAAHDRGDPPPEGVTLGSDGDWLVPVTVGWASSDDLEASAALIALNRAVELGGWVDEELVGLLMELHDAGADQHVGFTVSEIHALRDKMLPITTGDPDDIPAPPPATTTRGDVWILGPHRVVCGDSTEPETWDRLLLDGERAHMVWTDPPYGVDYEGGTRDRLTISNDALGDEATEAMLRAAFTETLSRSLPGAHWYVCEPAGPQVLPFQHVLSDLRVWRQTLVWVKSSLVLGRSDYHYQHENVAYGWSPGEEPLTVDEYDTLLYGWNPTGRRLHPVPNRRQSTVLRFDKPSASDSHPTMKPVALITYCLVNSSHRTDLVADPFGGSGSTLIACHDTARLARLVEIDPVYVDVICRRFQRYTGIVPVLARTGTPVDFDN